MSQSETFVAEELQDKKQTYINQPCPICTVNHDYKFKGRTILCVCGCYIKESVDKKGRLMRVG